jgi:hypothetical protein
MAASNKNITWHKGAIGREERERLAGQQASKRACHQRAVGPGPW